ncbi:hypothetical protein ACOMHN_050019 [Nucella lapillus]
MGLDLELFEGDVPEDLVCGLCHKVVVHPVHSSTCTHLFCKACLRRQRLEGQKAEEAPQCPTCGVALEGEAPKPPGVDLKVKLLGLVIHCSHHCGKVCTLAELPDHVGKDCPNAPVTCPHVKRGCKMAVKRAEVEEHTEECDYRHVLCEACGQRTIFIDLFTHQSRKRCLEKKLRQQLIKAVRITNLEVKQHKRSLDRQHQRLEHQQQQRFMDLQRQTMATAAKDQRHTTHHPAANSSGGTSSCNGSEYDSRSIVSTEVMSFDPHHPAPPHSRDMFLTSSRAVEGRGEGVEDRAVTLHPLSTPSQSEPSVFVCRNCRRPFRENLNSPNACRWHPGTCYSCGRLDYQKGCMTGYHEQ